MKPRSLAFTIGLVWGHWLGAAAATNSPAVLTLAAAHDLALRHHPQIAAADYRTLAAGEVVKQAVSGYYPSLALYGSAVGADSRNTRLMAGGLNNPSVFERAAAGLGVSQLLTDFGRTANLASSSKFQAQAENQNAAATRETVLLQVDAEYLQALQARAVLQVARQTLETRQLLLDQVSVLASNQLKSELDVSFSRVALEQARLLSERARNDSEAALAGLSTAVGYREFHRFELVEEALAPAGETNDVSRLILIALERRPELLRLRAEQAAALHLARAQRDARLPTVAATGAAGGAALHDERLPDNYAAAGIQVSVPLYAGGLYSARQHEAELRASAAAELLRSMEANVARDVRIAWLNVNNARERLRTTEQLVVHAGESYDLAQARYKAGSSSIVELSQAQLDLTSAQIANTSERYDVLIQQSNLRYQTGTLAAGAAAASPAPK